jgi:hypothetical protein
LRCRLDFLGGTTKPKEQYNSALYKRAWERDVQNPAQHRREEKSSVKEKNNNRPQRNGRQARTGSEETAGVPGRENQEKKWFRESLGFIVCARSRSVQYLL